MRRLTLRIRDATSCDSALSFYFQWVKDYPNCAFHDCMKVQRNYDQYIDKLMRGCLNFDRHYARRAIVFGVSKVPKHCYVGRRIVDKGGSKIFGSEEDIVTEFEIGRFTVVMVYCSEDYVEV
jgi:hypothetical protein